jgi:hypothetical protein
MKNVHVIEEAFRSQKRLSNTSKHEILKKILLLWVIFALLDPDLDLDSESGSTDPIGSGSFKGLNLNPQRMNADAKPC